MSARLACLVLALAACSHSDDPLAARSKQFCHSVGASFEVSAESLERVCAKPNTCVGAGGHEEDVGDERARLGVQSIRAAHELGAVKLCAPAADEVCVFGDYPCLIRVGHAVGKALP